MRNEIIVNVHPLEKRLAMLENSKLVELIIEKKDNENVVNNIYKGIVKDVLPGMGAAFIDIGLDRTAFLHYSDIVGDFLEYFDQGTPEKLYKEHDSSKIGDVLKPGQEIIVQVQKGPINKKGARMTGRISLPGKFLVFFPNQKKVAISRKITNQNERNRIRTILKDVKDKNVGLIVRTEGEGCTKEELEAEYKAMAKTWRLIEKQIKHAKPPLCVFEENDLANVLIRDLFSAHVDHLVIDDKNFVKHIKAQLQDISPELVDRVELYQEDSPIFDAYGIEKKIETIFHSKIYLPSGGNIVIEQTEAMVVIDINTGSFTGNKNYEQTVKKTNIESAVEIARQLRLRDLSGIVVVDFIDMKEDSSRDEVMQTLRRELKKDRAKTKIYSFGPLGLVQITRKRVRNSLMLSYSEQCPQCFGTGRIVSRDAVMMRINRWVSRAEYFMENEKIKIKVHTNVRKYLLDNPTALRSYKLRVDFETDDSLRPDEFKVYRMSDGVEITEEYNA
ncbi:MAG: Rne/Rng family ribonuclease [Candidatus Cloacimonetes bacterium]|nr:Rne/Rng family ribonuclease [Candidatus Cloacimonadota bacterium]